MGFLIVSVMVLAVAHYPHRTEVHSRIPNIRHSNEDLEWVLLVRLSDTPLDITFDFGFPFLSMTKIDS